MLRDLATGRGISDVMHYTTERGIYGVIVKNATLSRERLEDDADLEFIFQSVWPVKAPEWKDYVSLTLSRINLDLFERSRRHFPDLWWGVLSFNTEILDHAEVVFTTTNNIYPACRRAAGPAGFEAMFADPVRGKYDYEHTRAGVQDCFTTDRAAEVLYLGELSLDHLQVIYVPAVEHRRLVHAWCDALGRPDLPVQINAAVFA